MTTTKLNKTTKKAARWIEEYFNSRCHSVDDFYAAASSHKRAIERGIKARLSENHLIGYTIINCNSFCFTCGYMTADKKTLFVETSANIYEIEL